MNGDSKSGIDVSSIRAPEIPPPSPHTRKISKQERDLYDVHTAGLRQDIAERKRYARRTFWLCCSWIIAIYVILILQGFGHAMHFAFSEHVILAAIGSTTANIIGVFLIVARYLFHDKPH